MGASDFSKLPFIGESIRRKEDYRFLTGAGQYTDDINLQAQTHAVFVRSPHAHALIKSIDISAAHLGQAGSRLQARHPQVPMLGLCADYSQPLVLPLPPPLQQRPRLGFFPGSSLGNFEPA